MSDPPIPATPTAWEDDAASPADAGLAGAPAVAEPRHATWAEAGRWIGVAFFGAITLTQLLPWFLEIAPGVTLWSVSSGQFGARLLVVAPGLLCAACTLCFLVRQPATVPITAVVALSPWTLWRTTDRATGGRGIYVHDLVWSLSLPEAPYTAVYRLYVYGAVVLFTVGLIWLLGFLRPVVRVLVGAVDRWFRSDESLVPRTGRPVRFRPDVALAAIGFVFAVVASTTALVEAQMAEPTFDPAAHPWLRAIRLGLLGSGPLLDQIVHVLCQVSIVAAFVGVVGRGSRVRRRVWLGAALAGALLTLSVATYAADVNGLRFRPTAIGLAWLVLTTLAFLVAAWATTADADDEHVDDGADRPVDDEAVGHVVEGAEDGGQGGPAVA